MADSTNDDNIQEDDDKVFEKSSTQDYYHEDISRKAVGKLFIDDSDDDEDSDDEDENPTKPGNHETLVQGFNQSESFFGNGFTSARRNALSNDDYDKSLNIDEEDYDFSLYRKKNFENFSATGAFNTSQISKAAIYSEEDYIRQREAQKEANKPPQAENFYNEYETDNGYTPFQPQPPLETYPEDAAYRAAPPAPTMQQPDNAYRSSPMQQPNDMYREPIPMQQPNDMYREPIPMQQPNDMYREPMPMQQPNDMYREPIPMQQPNDMYRAPTMQQPDGGYRPATQKQMPRSPYDNQAYADVRHDYQTERQGSSAPRANSSNSSSNRQKREPSYEEDIMESKPKVYKKIEPKRTFESDEAEIPRERKKRPSQPSSNSSNEPPPRRKRPAPAPDREKKPRYDDDIEDNISYPKPNKIIIISVAALVVIIIMTVLAFQANAAKKGLKEANVKLEELNTLRTKEAQLTSSLSSREKEIVDLKAKVEELESQRPPESYVPPGEIIDPIRNPTDNPPPNNNSGTVLEDSGKTYTVVAGDTVSAISKKFYSTANQYNKIINFNNLPNEGKNIKVGDILKIPK